MPINKNEITKEMLEKAMKCKTAEDLMALAKAEGVAITKDEAEAYMAELRKTKPKHIWLNWPMWNWMEPR